MTVFLCIFFTALSMPWCCPPGEPDYLTSELAYSTEQFLGLLCRCCGNAQAAVWATAESALMLDMVIFLEQPWENLDPVMRVLWAHRAGGNASGVFLSCRYNTRGNWRNMKVIKKQVVFFQPIYGLLLWAALLNSTRNYQCSQTTSKHSCKSQKLYCML